jgi:hypothetical protein
MTIRRQKYKLNNSIKFVIKKDFEIEIFSSYFQQDLFWFDYVEGVIHYRGTEYVVY